MRRKQARGTHRFHVNLNQEQADKLRALCDHRGWSFSVAVGFGIERLYAEAGEPAILPVASTDAN